MSCLEVIIFIVNHWNIQGLTRFQCRFEEHLANLQNTACLEEQREEAF